MKFQSATTALVMAGIAGSAMLAATSNAAQLPLPAQELVARMQTALTQGELLKNSFYTTVSLQQFFGPGYRFTFAPDLDGAKTIYFDDGDNVYVDQNGAPTDIGQHRPCLQRGTIMFEKATGTRKARASIAIETMGPAAPSSAFDAALVQRVLGAPTIVTAGAPSSPPAHGRPYQTTPQLDPSSILWLSYQTDANGIFQRLKFRMQSDATIAEIQLFEEQR